MRESRRKIKKQDLNTPAAPIRKRYSASPFVVQQPLAIARHPVSFSYALKALHSSDVEGIELTPFYTLCEELLQRFPAYSTAVQTRKQSLAGLQLNLQAGDNTSDKVSVAVSQFVGSRQFKKLKSELAEYLNYGIAAVELFWNYDKEAGQLTLSKSALRPLSWFNFDGEGESLRLKSENPGGPTSELAAGKWAICSFNPSLVNSVKQSLPAQCALLSIARSMSLQEWAFFIEKYGSPSIVAKYPNGTLDDEETVRLENMLANFKSSSYAMLPDGSEFQVVAPASLSSVDAFQRFIEYADTEATKIVLGQTLTTQSGNGSGSYALGQVHNEVRLDKLKNDAEVLADSLQYVVDLYVQLNFGENVAAPTVSLQVEEPEDVKAKLDAAKAHNLPIPRNYLYKVLGIPAPLDGEVVVVGGQEVLYSEASQPPQ